MANYRYNGRTFSIEAALLPPDNQQYACMMFGPYFDQQCVVLIQSTEPGSPIQYRRFDSPEAAIQEGQQEIRDQLGPEVPFLRRFMNQLKEHEMLHPLREKILRINSQARLDWRAITQDDWTHDGWSGEDQNLTSMGASSEVYIEALKRRLSRVGIVDVELTNDVPYMEIVNRI